MTGQRKREDHDALKIFGRVLLNNIVSCFLLFEMRCPWSGFDLVLVLWLYTYILYVNILFFAIKVQRGVSCLQGP